MVVPSNTDLIYELSVLQCQESLDKLNEKNYQAKNKAPLPQTVNSEEEEMSIIGSAPPINQNTTVEEKTVIR